MTRIVLLVLLLATGGAIVNVAVAWALYISHLRAIGSSSEQVISNTDVDDALWERHIGPIAAGSDRLNQREIVTLGALSKNMRVWRVLTGFYSPEESEALRKQKRTNAVSQTICGLPLMCASIENWEMSAVHGPVEYHHNGLESFGIVLPIRFAPSGFAINTIFYAVILWMIFAIPFVLLRRRRIKRGLCPACAYPVGGSPVCTECGRAVTPH